MTGSEMPLPAIDLDGPVTREQYNTMANVLAPALDAFGRRAGWCSERHDHFTAILPEYTSDYYDRATATPATDETADYAQKARDVRGRILWHVRNRSYSRRDVTIQAANRLLAAAGLPEYPVPEGTSWCEGCDTYHTADGSLFTIPAADTVRPTWTGYLTDRSGE